MSSIAQKRRRDIYMFDGGEGRQYIGQTVELESRIRGHRSRCEIGYNNSFYRAVRKHPQGWDAFPVRVLASGWWTDEQANDAEEGYIAYHNTYHNGLNETKGGGGATGRVLSQEEKDKRSIAVSGEKNPFFNRKHSTESIEKMREVKLGEKNPNFGKPRPQSVCDKIGNAQRGEKHHMFGRLRSLETRAKQSYTSRLRNYENNGTMKIF